ncbi:MAG: DUF2252 domain-containing protein [Ilumatobacteraceae bacterium]|nr:DUF2252 domain-containing protein [Ilumatobacteraceae bacterium]
MPEATATPTIQQASSDARHNAGMARRRTVSLDSHATCPPQTDRPDPVEILLQQDTTRLPYLIPIRHGRMSATAFTFYRGGAAIMAADLSMTPTAGLQTQLCGDAHLSNFGLFKGPDRRLVFDLNDFDETLPGPFEWDVKRLAASLTIAGRHNDLPAKEISKVTRSAVKTYRETMAKAAESNPLQVHYFRLKVEDYRDGLDKQQRKRQDKLTKKAHAKNSLRALKKLTEVVDGRSAIKSDPPLITRMDEMIERNGIDELARFYQEYRSTLPRYRQVLLDQYGVVDIAHKVVGVGSVGTRCLILLLESSNGSPLFLQFKEARASVLEPYLGASEFELAGQRVVVGQRLMQSTSDIFLGWARHRGTATGVEDVDFYFRQLWDGKGSAEVDSMNAKELKRYARLCGGALGLAHARSGDAAMISGYLGDDSTFDHAIAAFADSYADLNDHDYDLHQQAIRSGKIHVVKDI